jgi:YD repeat-containing protein
LELKGSLSLSAPSQFSLFTPDKVPVDYTVAWSIAPMEDCVECSQQSDASGATVSTENQSLGQKITLAGLPFELHYQSERAEGRALSSKTAETQGDGLGGWTLGVHHAYDPTLNTLFLGNGSRRDSAALGKVWRTANGHYLVANVGGAVVHEFDANGRHVRTRHALTGATLYSFNYDAAGRLVRIADGDGNLTKIKRDAGGHPSALIGPYGQRTALTVDVNGHLASVTGPGGQTIKLTTNAKGLVKG